MSSSIISKQPRHRTTSSFQRGYRSRSVAKHEALCASCGVATMLPFKPTTERPGYCSTCFLSQKQRSVGDIANDEATVHYDYAHPRRQRPEQNAHLDIFPGLNLRPRTRSALSRMGITTPTPIQQQAIPWLNEGRDVVGQAQTGSGKTLAFGIPLVEKTTRSQPGVQGIVLVPTRELAIQVASVLEDIAEHRVSVTLLYGGRSLINEKRSLQKSVQIVVGTPGRTLDHLRQGNLSLSSVQMLVLDEADEMLDRGFARDVEAIIAQTPVRRQTALFSATLPDWVAKTSDKHLRTPKTVQVMTASGDVPRIEHLIYKMEKATKTPALRALLDERGEAPILIFGRTKHGVKKLAKQLAEMGYPVTALQGNLSQSAREKAIEDFRSGATPVLVATNVAARGLDIDGISQVINYDLPDSIQLFTHRVGRTGRMGKSGEAITFVTPDDEKKWREIERGFDAKIITRRWGPGGPDTKVESHTSSSPSKERFPDSRHGSPPVSANDSRVVQPRSSRRRRFV